MTSGLQLVPRERVLVVDDDAGTRHVLERSLRELGYEVLVASGGAQGLALATEHHPAVVITDIYMPEMDGHALLQRLSLRRVDAAVIVTSGAGTMDDVVEAMRAGAVDYLKKPWTSPELDAAVTRAVELHATRLRGQPGRPDVPIGPAPVAEAMPLRSGHLPMPAAPLVLGRLRKMARRSGATLDETASMIASDAELGEQVLRVAQSRLFRHPVADHDLGAAIRCIGMERIHNVVETIVLHRGHQVDDPGFAPVLQRLWHASLARALAMRALVGVAAVPEELSAEIAYAAGLFADVGASFLLTTIGERSLAGVAGRLDPERYLPAVRARHESCGENLLAGWGLDPAVVVVAGTHHMSVPPTPPSSYWQLAVLASALVDRLTPGDDVSSIEPVDPDLVTRCAEELGIEPEMLDRLALPVSLDLVALLAILP